MTKEAKYKIRKDYKLKLSERQKEQISILYEIINLVDFHNFKIQDILNINTEYWEKQTSFRKKYCDNVREEIKDLKVGKQTEYGRFIIKKAKKGYVLTLKNNWRSKGIEVKKLKCSFCKKSDLINWECICKKCEKHLKKKRKYMKFLCGEWKPK